MTQDVDFSFEDLGDPRIREALQDVGAAYVPPSHLNPPMFAGGGVELFDIVLTMHKHGPFEEEVRQCIEVPLGRQKLKVLPWYPGKQASREPRPGRLVGRFINSLTYFSSGDEGWIL